MHLFQKAVLYILCSKKKKNNESKSGYNNNNDTGISAQSKTR